MATGYTYPIISGEEEISFNKFAWDLARVRGKVRPLLDPATGSSTWNLTACAFHQEALTDALAMLSNLSVDWEAKAEEYNKECEERYKAACQDYSKNISRFENMLKKVEEWEPPTKDHESLKDFMIDQISESIDHEYVPTKVEAVDAATLRTNEIAKIKCDIQYHSERLIKEIEGVELARAWVDAMVKSIGEPE